MITHSILSPANAITDVDDGVEVLGKDMDDVTNFLSETLIFKGLSNSELGNVAAIVQRKKFEEKDYIVREGEDGDSLYIIISGSVNVTKGEGAREKYLTTLGSGSFFGEMSLFDDIKRTANIRVAESTEVFQIYRDPFMNLLESDLRMSHKILLNLIRSFCQRLKYTSDELSLLW